MNLRVNRIHYPVTTLGPGRRIAIWVQGCGIGCRGCLSPDTWEPLDSTEVAVADVVAACRRLAPEGTDGITISGGEPFEQPEGVSALIDALRGWHEELGRPVDVLCYSGMSLRRLQHEHPELLARIDALVPEPFIVGRPPGGPWRGSDNQPLVLLSELAEERYTGSDAPRSPRLQVDVTHERILLIGLPERGDIARHRSALAAAGIELHEEWRP